MTILEYTQDMKPALADLLCAYFPEVDAQIPDDIIRGKLCNLIQEQHESGILRISVPYFEEKPIGFSIYQIDTPESDWCKRPGWGFIREFFIEKPCRRKGYGRMLADFTEQQLTAMGAAELYLTADDASGFWERCGWCNTHEICSNNLEVLTK